jgi:exosortase C (VPDSG-CTERM-specific)
MPFSWTKFWIFVVALSIGFSVPLYKLFAFAAGSSLYSYIILIPFVSLYLGWTRLPELAALNQAPRAPRVGMVLASLAGVAFLAISFTGHDLDASSQLAILTASFLSFLFAGCFWFMNSQILRTLVFPLGFLLFMIPFPKPVENCIVDFLQQGSVMVADLLFTVSGTSVVCNDSTFRLPGFSLQVAPECSGIHSTLVLFITSIVGSWFFLRTPWKRAVFVFAIIPLALLRNGFRVFVIGMLCVHVDQKMIDSPIHHHGGPLFFVLSLIPFSVLLYYLYKSDHKSRKVAEAV